MTDRDNTFGQPSAGADNDNNQPIEIPPTITLPDVIELMRLQHLDNNKFREEILGKIEALSATKRDRTNRPRRRHHSTSSLSSNDPDHDILHANSRSQHAPTPAPIIPTPVPQNPTSIPRPLSPNVHIQTPAPQTQMIIHDTNYPSTTTSFSSPPNIIQHNTPSLSPKDYIQSIPYFDGTPMCYDASELIIHCKNALSYIPRYKEYEILALLTGRLKGEALRRAYKAKLRTVQDLINFIKENFDKPKTYFSLRNQILKLEQGTYESMSTYIARAQELLSDCTECLLTSNVPNKESARQTLNDDITNGFVHGTLKKYLRLFTTKNFPSFAAACAEARRAEGELAVFDMNKVENLISILSPLTSHSVHLFTTCYSTEPN
ncbi:hypothetical protein PV325_005505 [Microctonus aethiopoides]|nr:hypothetical protein PV325_005505 [Microctonus aethiopoides]